VQTGSKLGYEESDWGSDRGGYWGSELGGYSWSELEGEW
jgi:hypothetical protein